MAELVPPAIPLAPDWLIAEMPPGYQNRVAEMQRLSADLEAMNRFGRLLWSIGPPLTEAVREAFAALKFETEVRPGQDASAVTVKVDTTRRLLIYVSAADSTIQRKSTDLAQVFQMLHESSEDGDRVVLVANSDPITRPMDRRDSIGSDALQFLSRMGANFLTAPTLFNLWTQSLQDQDRARKNVERMHAQDGGAFLLPALSS